MSSLNLDLSKSPILARHGFPPVIGQPSTGQGQRFRTRHGGCISARTVASLANSLRRLSRNVQTDRDFSLRFHSTRATAVIALQVSSS